jgi:quercetin 2,3-dioxygenase
MQFGFKNSTSSQSIKRLLFSVTVLSILLLINTQAQETRNSFHADSDNSASIDSTRYTTTTSHMDTSSTQKSSSLNIKLRRSGDRGHANLGWLDSYHSFSFANYYDPKFDGFGSLRVINEDRVEGSQGFDTHPHANYEIFSYIVSGALRHKDSMGNTEVIERGGVQFTSAGTGISHSEFNAHKTKPVHFIQMWVKPNARGLPPGYQTRTWSDEQKVNQLRKMLSPDGADETIKINQQCNVYASMLDKDATVQLNLAEGRQAYVHLIQTDTNAQLELNGHVLSAGDGAFITGSGQLEFKGASDPRAEFILFDLKVEN